MYECTDDLCILLPNFYCLQYVIWIQKTAQNLQRKPVFSLYFEVLFFYDTGSPDQVARSWLEQP